MCEQFYCKQPRQLMNNNKNKNPILYISKILEILMTLFKKKKVHKNIFFTVDFQYLHFGVQLQYQTNKSNIILLYILYLYYENSSNI